MSRLTHGKFRITAYCECGASMTGSGTGALAAADELTSAFWSVHSGEGHGPASREVAYRARKRQARSRSTPT